MFDAGASSLGSVFRATSDDDAVEVVRTAIRKGINFIDTAAWYGHGKSETVLGKVRSTTIECQWNSSTLCTSVRHWMVSLGNHTTLQQK